MTETHRLVKFNNVGQINRGMQFNSFPHEYAECAWKSMA